MDLYALDEQLRRIEVFDVYTSLIWQERSAETGTFEFVSDDIHTVRKLLPIGTKVTVDDSQYVMTVENDELTENDDGVREIKLTGQSLEGTEFKSRACIQSPVGFVTSSKWELTGTPGNIVREMFQTICVDGDVDASDILPLYHIGVLNVVGNVPEPSDVITISLDPDDMYNSISSLCLAYNLGFRLVKNGDLSELYFEVFTGDDRTTAQILKNPVIFSKDLDSLSSIQELTSISDYKNVAYVKSKNGFLKVYADNADPTISGFNRKVLMVSAEDIELGEGPALDAALFQRGKEELSKHRVVMAFDGETPQNSMYKYGTDYRLNDLVEVKDGTGKVNIMRVTEQIRIRDAEGYREYPTLSFNQLITPGTWFAWPPQQQWSEVLNDTDHEWIDQ